MQNNRRAKVQLSDGFTLIEVIVAVAVIAIISLVSVQSITTANRAGEATERKLEKIHRLDRFWRFIEMDLRNALKYDIASPFGEAFKAMLIEKNETYFLTHLRGGIANPLMAQRTEVGRVAYRLEDGIIWRDSWYEAANPEEETAFKQKLIAKVEEVTVLALPPTVRSLEDRNWVERWPIPQSQQNSLPIAVRVNVIFEDEREITRIFPLPLGE